MKRLYSTIGTLQLNIHVVQTFWLLQPTAFLMFPPSSPSSLLKLPIFDFHIRHTNLFVPQTFGKRLVFSFSRDVYYSQEKLKTINMQNFFGNNKLHNRKRESRKLRQREAVTLAVLFFPSDSQCNRNENITLPSI